MPTGYAAREVTKPPNWHELVVWDFLFNAATTGPLGTIRSGAIERANVDITEELVALISAQRNFQANAKAIETASTMTQTIINLHT